MYTWITNQYGQVISYLFCNGADAEERVPMTTEIYQRLIKFGNMKGSLSLDEEQDLSLAPTSSSPAIPQPQIPALSVRVSQRNNSVGPIGMIPYVSEEKWDGPIIFSDLCCKDKKCFEDGGFKDFIMLGDIYHITKRIIDTLCKDFFTYFCMCIKDLRFCFGSDELGVFWDGEKIIAKIEALKEVYIPTGTWTPATTAKFEIEKHHIMNCLHFPKVSIVMKIFLFIFLYYLESF
jgi:hypothetical protein